MNKGMGERELVSKLVEVGCGTLALIVETMRRKSQASTRRCILQRAVRVAVILVSLSSVR